MIKHCATGGETFYGHPEIASDGDAGRLRVSVVYTTLEGTLAALSVAARCARSLCADIGIVVAQEVPSHYEVEKPPVSAAFFEGLCFALAEELGLERDICHVEVYFCRDQMACLMRVLKPKMPVVLGAGRGWWLRRERRLEKRLRTRGFDPVLVHDASRFIQYCAWQAARRMAVVENTASLDKHRGWLDSQ